MLYDKYKTVYTVKVVTIRSTPEYGVIEIENEETTIFKDKSHAVEAFNKEVEWFINHMSNDWYRNSRIIRSVSSDTHTILTGVYSGGTESYEINRILEQHIMLYEEIIHP